MHFRMENKAGPTIGTGTVLLPFLRFKASENVLVSSNTLIIQEIYLQNGYPIITVLHENLFYIYDLIFPHKDTLDDKHKTNTRILLV